MASPRSALADQLNNDPPNQEEIDRGLALLLRAEVRRAKSTSKSDAFLHYAEMLRGASAAEADHMQRAWTVSDRLTPSDKTDLDGALALRFGNVPRCGVCGAAQEKR